MTEKLTIVKYGDPILRKKGEKITVFDAALKDFARELHETLLAGHGIGLAAHQVGKPLMMCVIDTQLKPKEIDFDYDLDGKKPPFGILFPLVLINPIVKLSKGDLVTYNEGCLSVPGLFADVERPDELTVRYQDVDGAPHTLTCNGLLSRVVQHETDHLQGILFIDRMRKSDLKKHWDALEAIKNAPQTNN